MVILKWALHKYVVIFFKLFPMFNKGPNRAHVRSRPLLTSFSLCYFPIVVFGNVLRTLWKLWKPIKTFKRTNMRTFRECDENTKLEPWYQKNQPESRLVWLESIYWEDTQKHKKHVMLCFLVLITHAKCA